jgi:hypothetical protein
MTDVAIGAEVAALLREAAAAHHRAFAASNGDDPDWPEWYADHLSRPLARVLGQSLATPVLAAELRALDASHRTAPGRTDWPEYYAAHLVARFSTM